MAYNFIFILPDNYLFFTSQIHLSKLAFFLQVKFNNDTLLVMVDKKKQNWAGCPIRFGMSQFGDKWSFLIIRDLMFKGRKYYSEFLEAGEGISTNILASRLADLEHNGIVSKRQDAVKRSKNIYSLTEKGIALMPMMLAMIDWAERYDDQTEVPAEFARKLRQTPEVLQKELLNLLEND